MAGHAGRCVDERAGFRCVCALGYSGSRCDIDVDDCETLRGPCLNGGFCVDGLDTFTCRCPPGYSGPLCQLRAPVAVDRCQGGPRSDCAVDNAVSVAEEDDSSETSLSTGVDCRSSPCLNGATCVDDDKSRFRCVCRGQFRGRRCHIQAVKRRHRGKLGRSSSSSTFNISTTPSTHSAAVPTVSNVSAIERASTSPSGVNSRQSLIVVVSPVTAPVVVFVVIAVVVAVVVVLGGGMTVCVWWQRRRRVRRRDVIAAGRRQHAIITTHDRIHNDVLTRRYNNLANCKTVAKLHNVSSNAKTGRPR